MRFWLIAMVAVLTVLCGSASAYAPKTSASHMQICHVQSPADQLGCVSSDINVQGAQKHHAPTPKPVQLPERAMRTHPSYFMHPEQQPMYLLAYTLAQDAPLCELSPIGEQIRAQVPWFMVNSQPNSGLIDNCKPANLTYRSRLTYELFLLNHTA